MCHVIVSIGVLSLWVFATWCVPALEIVGRHVGVFREERIGVKESAYRWPVLGGPSGSAHMISGDKVNRQWGRNMLEARHCWFQGFVWLLNSLRKSYVGKSALFSLFFFLWSNFSTVLFVYQSINKHVFLTFDRDFLSRLCCIQWASFVNETQISQLLMLCRIIYFLKFVIWFL